MEAGAERPTCPACGGAGGGPFGRAGSAWDDESYMCPRCKGVGVLGLDDAATPSVRPGLVKVAPDARDALPAKKRKATA